MDNNNNTNNEISNETITRIFHKNNNTNTLFAKQTKSTIIPFTQDNILNLCNKLNDNVIINFKYFKYMATPENYSYILTHVVNVLKNVYSEYGYFNVHFCLQSLTPTQIGKHYNFIKNSCEVFKNEFPDMLKICYIHDAPFIFNQLYDIIAIFIDKKTKQKIVKV